MTFHCAISTTRCFADVMSTYWFLTLKILWVVLLYGVMTYRLLLLP